MTIFAVQYLESSPSNATPGRVRTRLKQAFDILPISMVLLGWNLPARMEESVANESARQGAALYRWHPLLASDGGFHLPEEWRTIGLEGDRLSGFQDLPEFTFICPNRADVQEWMAERLESEAQRGLYQGFFFDRMRFPSPAEDFPRKLACFCKSCRRAAADTGLDLETVRRYLNDSGSQTDSAAHVRGLLYERRDLPPTLLHSFLDFRARVITHTIQSAADQVRSQGLRVGLDCFSPTLTRMVGQDLGSLSGSCDWIKIMTYPRVFGPAGLPFELIGLVDSLIRSGLNRREALKLLADASQLPLPEEIAGLRKTGLGSEALSREIKRGRKAGVKNLLAGVALVEMEGVHESTAEQIDFDLQASREADGLVLSWDLWHIPPERLDQVRVNFEIP